MAEFDYGAPAELFPSLNRKVKQKVKYRRFEKAADAIRFAMEEMPPMQLLGATIEVDEARLGHETIRQLYESENFPLKRRAA
jgi:Arc/MetJ-type ribon-helix-helix transcriptional regulator